MKWTKKAVEEEAFDYVGIINELDDKELIEAIYGDTDELIRDNPFLIDEWRKELAKNMPYADALKEWVEENKPELLEKGEE